LNKETKNNFKNKEFVIGLIIEV